MSTSWLPSTAKTAAPLDDEPFTNYMLWGLSQLKGLSVTSRLLPDPEKMVGVQGERGAVITEIIDPFRISISWVKRVSWVKWIDAVVMMIVLFSREKVSCNSTNERTPSSAAADAAHDRIAKQKPSDTSKDWWDRRCRAVTQRSSRARRIGAMC